MAYKKEKKQTNEELRDAGEIYVDGSREIIIEPVRSSRGFGRWIYCKYCYKNVKPMLSGINMIVCSSCGCGLTPDFFLRKNLERWMSNDKTALEDDRKSKKAEKWNKDASKGKHSSSKISIKRIEK